MRAISHQKEPTFESCPHCYARPKDDEVPYPTYVCGTQQLLGGTERSELCRVLNWLETGFDVSAPGASIEYRCGYEVSRDRIVQGIENGDHLK